VTDNHSSRYHSMKQYKELELSGQSTFRSLQWTHNQHETVCWQEICLPLSWSVNWLHHWRAAWCHVNVYMSTSVLIRVLLSWKLWFLSTTLFVWWQCTCMLGSPVCKSVGKCVSAARLVLFGLWLWVYKCIRYHCLWQGSLLCFLLHRTGIMLGCSCVVFSISCCTGASGIAACLLQKTGIMLGCINHSVVRCCMNLLNLTSTVSAVLDGADCNCGEEEVTKDQKTKEVPWRSHMYGSLWTREWALNCLWPW